MASEDRLADTPHREKGGDVGETDRATTLSSELTSRMARTSGTRESSRVKCMRRTFLRAGGVGVAGLLASTATSAAASGGSVPGETGALTVRQPDTTTGHTVSLARTYENPVVVIKPVGFEGHQPVHVRLGDVSSGEFTFRIEEWDYLDGAHITERLFYLVVESGSHTLADGTTVQAGTIAGDHRFRGVAFPTAFATRPVVFTQSQTYRGGHEIVTRNRRVSTSGFDTRVQEEEGRDGWHTTERIGYVATEPTTATGFEIGRTPDTVTDDPFRIGFENDYDSVQFLADMQTTDGTDTAELRYRGLTSSSATLFVEEERSADRETGHITEAVGYLATAPGALFGDGAGGDPAGYGAGGYGVGAYGT